MASASRPSSKSEVLGFADFRLDLRAGNLHRNGSVVRMQRQPFQLLAHLVEHAGEVVSREELRQLLWQADTFVDFDNGLNATINKIREALGDAVEHPRFVETLPRRGYRFIAPVSVIPWNGAPPVLAERAAASPVVASKLETTGRQRTKRLLGVALGTAATIAAVVGWQLLTRFVPPQEARTEQITTNAAEIPITGSAISPDGKFLAYSDPAGTYLRVVATGETHVMPLPAGLELRPDAWFPDSANFIATDYTSSRPGEEPSLWMVPVVGTPRKLLDNAFAAAVSPDGSRIACVRGALNVNTQGGREIWVMSTDGTASHLVAKGDLTVWVGSVAWSPDSRRIAYIRAPHRASESGETPSVQVLSLEGQQPSALLSDYKLGSALLWMPDGRIIYTLADSTRWGLAFSSFASRSFSIWAVPVSAAGHATGQPVRIASASGDVSRLSWTASTGTLTFVNEVKQMDACISELEAGGTSATPPRRLTLSDANDVPFAWTSDSRSIIFISDRNRYVNIYRQTIDQATPELIVGGQVNSWTPRAAPDGQHLVYIVDPRTDAATSTPERGKSDWPTHIMKVPITGGLPQRVLTDDHVGDINCSRTGCVFVTFHSDVAYFAFDPNTGANHEILRIPANWPSCCGWHLSPDGGTIAFTGPPNSGRFNLLSLSDKTTREVVISNWRELGSSEEPTLSGFDWAADGKGLYLCVDMKPTGLGLVYVDLEGHSRVLLKGGNIRWAIPSPDGRHLALHTFSTVRNVWFAAMSSGTRRFP